MAYRDVRQDDVFGARLAEEAPWLRVVVQRRLARADDAEDIAQEALAKAWKGRASFDLSRDMKPWLFSIARRVSIDLSRRRREEPDPDCGFEESDEDADPFRWMAADEMRGSMSAAMNALPPRYRRVLESRFIGNLTYAEIADAEATTVVAVKPLLSRARSRFRSEYVRTGSIERLGAALGLGAASRWVARHINRADSVVALGSAAGACCMIAAVAITGIGGDTPPSGDDAIRQGTPVNAEVDDVPAEVPVLTPPPASVRLEPARESSPGPTSVVAIADANIDVDHDRERVAIRDRIELSPEDSGNDHGPSTEGHIILECHDPEATAPLGCLVLELIHNEEPD